MTTPVRLQRSRKKGARLVSPNGLQVLCVSRPSKWGNHFRVDAPHPAHSFPIARSEAAQLYDDWLNAPEQAEFRESVKRELSGKNLACYCKLCPKHSATGKPFDEPCSDCKPCHADQMLRCANS